MFTERFNQIMKRIDAKPAEIASIIGCDRSVVDRVCKGSRVPKNGGKSVMRLVAALYMLADENGKTDELLEEIACHALATSEEIKTEIMRWLYDGEKPEKTPAKLPVTLHTHDQFGYRFSSILDLAEFSNIRFAKLLSIDPSYISRFRNGLRTPVSNHKLTEDMCRIIYKRLKEQRKLSQLARLINLPAEELTNDSDRMKELYAWLFLSDDDAVSSFVVGMVDQIGEISADIIKSPLPFEAVADKEVLDDCKPLYRGLTGLQFAVLRFLGNVIKRKETDLYLYSDQNMDWITADKIFKAKWISLMIECVNSGVKIHIIHNVKRDLPEIGEAIKSWLPLYPSGQIESFYCDGQKNMNFSTTFFLCPGYACIYGNNVVSAENESGIYYYETKSEKLNLYREVFDTLLAKAHRLARVCKTADFSPLETISSDITVFSSCLTVFSMPESLFLKCFSRSELKLETSDVKEIYRQMKRFFDNALQTGFFRECAPLPGDEDLFEGRVYPEFLTSPYSPQEFAEHAKNITDLAENAKYRFYPLPDAVFSDVQLIISERMVALSRLKAPFFTIYLEHPTLCHAFVEYSDTIKKQYAVDKLTLKRKLERYF